MLIDEVTITIKAGDGGRGKIHFAPLMGGPDGGNGGKGGDVYIVGTTDLTALNQFAGKPLLHAEIGEPGGSQKKSGHGGGDLVLVMPVGTVITNTETNEKFIISQPPNRIKLAVGGRGGSGNFEFRSAILRAPRIAEPGQPGQVLTIFCNLELFADIGLIGLPNTGKSSLLNALTNAKAKVGAYPFTTLEPNLGVYKGVILADIPGIIEGASHGKGLGIRFLKHISKVSTIFHCLSIESTNPLGDYDIVRNELASYNPELLRKPELLLLTKTDIAMDKEIEEKSKLLMKKNKSILPISILDTKNLAALKRKISMVK